MPMRDAAARKRLFLALGLWLLLNVMAGLVLVRNDIASRREIFQTEARSAHRLLSQRMAQHEAILATLALNAPGDRYTEADLALPAGFDQLVSARRVKASGSVPARSEHAQFSAEALADSPGHYQLVMAHQGSAYRLVVDARRLLVDESWPWPTEGPVRVSLLLRGSPLFARQGVDEALRPAGLTEGFRFEQALASESQALVLRAQRWTGPAEWPWGRLLLVAAFSGLLVAWSFKALALRAERRRAVELQRLAKVARLNSLGELAAGMAHELNQPLTAVLSGTQAALRLLRDTDQEHGHDGVADALPALELAAAQARRAADVVTRLRGLVKPPALESASTAVDLHSLVRDLIHLLMPEFRRYSVEVELRGKAAAVVADRVAVEQILHNLLVNALQALTLNEHPDRRIEVHLKEHGQRVDCTVQDNGPGIAREHLAHVFEPFFSTRPEGLGLGLSLCQTLAQSMGGQLTVAAAVPSGASFCLSLTAAPNPSS